MIRKSPIQVDVSRLPLHEVLSSYLRAKPHLISLVDEDSHRSYSYGQLDDGIRRVASGLHRLGLSKGDFVLILCPNCAEYVFSVFAVVANGAVAALVNPSQTAYELQNALNLVKPKWIITVPRLFAKINEATKTTTTNIKATIVVTEHGLHSSDRPLEGELTFPCGFVPFEVLLDDDGSWFPSLIQIDSAKDPAILMFSSGTTGPQKGVLLSHYNIAATIEIIVQGGRLVAPSHKSGEQQVLLAFLPFCHSTGLTMSLLRGLVAGQKVIILKRFHLERVLHCIETYKVTILPLVPPVFLLLAKSPLVSKRLSSVRRVFVGAAPLSAATTKEFRDLTGCQEVRQGFGMTELTLTAINSSFSPRVKPGSVGVPVPNTEAKVVDIDSGQVVGANQTGEVWIRGPQVMLGYINNPETTRATIDDDGWLHTGDVGYFDDDGYFFIVDRIKELIKYKAFQVAPAELEALILTNPEVGDVAVVGVPDRESGELPKAFVVRKPGSRLSAEDIKRLVAENVSSYKHLRGGVEFVDQIPKSETGKILRRILKQKSRSNDPSGSKL